MAEPFLLIGHEGVQRIKEDCLDPVHVFVGKCVVENRIHEALGFTRTGSGSNNETLVLVGKVPTLCLMPMWYEISGNYPADKSVIQGVLPLIIGSGFPFELRLEHRHGKQILPFKEHAHRLSHRMVSWSPNGQKRRFYVPLDLVVNAFELHFLFVCEFNNMQ